jgi:hypothetical protein
VSEESAQAIAERSQLEWELGAAARTKPVQLVNNAMQPGDWVGVGVSGDPNDTVETVPHPTPVRDRLRAAANNPDLSEQDRASARECLRIAFHE